MEQYEQGGPAPAPKEKPATDLADSVARLAGRVEEQDRLIRSLQQELRRVKDKMDQHADYLNRQQRG